ncbi:L-lactate permease [Nitratidesulfovibrio vulgaris]|jgi:lactate permease|uniref:L-lactate permease n=2 Tax=Nitratidesulfovibrio vulgaris TaxID=881 RepID=Q725Z0_NITV2|nr:lactate permease LctP family transporter [Nitratidesulfovibrio vulgaris]GEB78758.1 L-lactate permease [Desulfovibrio desulfuricans]HBW15019.1 L-lactate permease [Desulfovibrio sp.]AAS97753.1 L-lactate permease [Nitratidesulfovibrio vulgaris str. Hildenborough]ABM27130.1 L-lactate transport [Nitratidesulfovibrio vulgaris DP4]ADP88179.1 L-lactate transport [Nitratidesulfovibrio vulgaris RCH1]
MNWIQNYDPLSSALGSALVAAIPLFILFYMLAVKRAKGHVAAFLGTTSAIVLAIAVWGMPVSLAASATLYGAAYGLFPIVWIVITAVWVYNMTVESGEFEIIKDSLARLTDDRRLQAIFIAFAFGSFIEGTAGFGTPVAITASMLVGLGFNPLYAAGICLIANTAPVAFGAIGIPIIVAGQVTGLDTMHISQIVGRQLPFLSVIVPMWLCVTMCGFKRAMEVLPAVAVAGVCFAGSQFVFSNYHGPTLPDIMSAIVTIIGLVLLLRVWKPATTWRFPGEAEVELSAVSQYSAGDVIRAWMPYIILAVMVFFWGLDGVKKVLDGIFSVSVDWPGLHNLIEKTAPIAAKNAPYAAKYKLNLISAGGTAILLSGLLAVPVMPKYGFDKAIACLFRTFYQLRFPVVTIAMILGLAQIMNYSGMSSTLGIAFTKTGWLFPFFAPLLGWLGVFLTGSDTSSNALFGGMQRATAEAVGVDPHLTVAANSSGGVTGKMISPQSISVATASTNMVGQEGSLFRFTLGHSIAMTLFVCVLTLLQAYPLKGMLP